MSIWKRLFGQRTKTEPPQAERLAALPAPVALDRYRLDRDRFVVLDLETTGLDTRRDEILSVGAVVIEAGRLKLNDQFERTARRGGDKPLANVLIHGLSPNQLAGGDHISEVLIDLLEFIGQSPVFAFHARFDEAMLKGALRRCLGHKLAPPFFDVAAVAAAVCPERAPRQNSLDQWLRQFGLNVVTRHNAASDALATAELLLIMLRMARNQGIHTLADLTAKAEAHKRLQAMRPQGH